MWVTTKIPSLFQNLISQPLIPTLLLYSLFRCPSASMILRTHAHVQEHLRVCPYCVCHLEESRAAFSMACVRVADLHVAAYAEALRDLDMGPIMGGLLLCRDLHTAAVDARSSDSDSRRRLVRGEITQAEVRSRTENWIELFCFENEEIFHLFKFFGIGRRAVAYHIF